MSPETTSTKVCPKCGTRLSENATRCLVCGHTFAPAVNKPATPTSKPVSGPKMPEVTLSLPVALAIVVVVLALGAAIVYAIVSSGGKAANVITGATATATITPTPTQPFTATATLTPTITQTPTPLAPVDYKVKPGEVCSSIALKFNVTVESIATLNGLPPDCGILYEGEALKIPQPTPTPPPPPTATLSAQEATDQACGKADYTVKDGDTVGGIARAYNVSVDTLKNYNGLTTDNIWTGMLLKVPLCQRLPTAGPTPTATPPPPYQAPNPLLPVDGTIYGANDDNITLQWSAVGPLRPNEAYAVTIVDVTSGEGQKTVVYVTDTKYIVTTALRPKDKNNHIFRWVVMAVRQNGSTADGQPIYEAGGALSVPRVFGWTGTGQ